MAGDFNIPPSDALDSSPTVFPCSNNNIAWKDGRVNPGGTIDGVVCGRAEIVARGELPQANHCSGQVGYNVYQLAGPEAAAGVAPPVALASAAASMSGVFAPVAAAAADAAPTPGGMDPFEIAAIGKYIAKLLGISPKTLAEMGAKKYRAKDGQEYFHSAYPHQIDYDAGQSTVTIDVWRGFNLALVPHAPRDPTSIPAIHYTLQAIQKALQQTLNISAEISYTFSTITIQGAENCQKLREAAIQYPTKEIDTLVTQLNLGKDRNAYVFMKVVQLLFQSRVGPVSPVEITALSVQLTIGKHPFLSALLKSQLAFLLNPPTDQKIETGPYCAALRTAIKMTIAATSLEAGMDMDSIRSAAEGAVGAFLREATQDEYVNDEGQRVVEDWTGEKDVTRKENRCVIQ
jgi:hypothetical protein